jgi:hypothetical protein
MPGGPQKATSSLLHGATGFRRWGFLSGGGPAPIPAILFHGLKPTNRHPVGGAHRFDPQELFLLR